MLKLIHSEDTFYPAIQQNEEQVALLKCLRVLKQVLNLNARLGTYDSDSHFFKLLCELSANKEYIEVESKFFIPIMKSHKNFWGFIEITNKDSVIVTKARIKKAVAAVNDILIPQIQPLSFIQSLDHIHYDGKPFSIYIETPSEIDGKKIASDIFTEYDFTNFIDVSEWVNDQGDLKLSDLRELRNTLLFVPETLELNEKNRSLLTLFSLLPRELKGASLLIHSSAPWERVKENIPKEREFLVHFEKRKYSFAKPYKPKKN